MYTHMRTLALALVLLFGLVALAQATEQHNSHSPLSSSHSRKSLAFRKKNIKELEPPTLQAREPQFGDDDRRSFDFSGFMFTQTRTDTTQTWNPTSTATTTTSATDSTSTATDSSTVTSTTTTSSDVTSTTTTSASASSSFGCGLLGLEACPASTTTSDGPTSASPTATDGSSSQSSDSSTADATTTAAPASTDPATTAAATTSSSNSIGCGLLGLEECTSSATSDAATTTAAASTDSAAASSTAAATTAPADASSTATTTACGLLGSLAGECTSSGVTSTASGTATASETASITTSAAISITTSIGNGTTTSDITTSTAVVGNSTSITTSPITTSTAVVSNSTTTTSKPITTTQVSANSTTTTTAANSTITTTSSSVIISFPSSSNTSSIATATDSSTLTSTASSTSITLPAAPSQFSFLTQTSLLLEPSTTSSSVSNTQTNPDAPATTLSVAAPSSAASASTTTAPAALPTYLAARVYPPTGTPTASSTNGDTLVSILFDSGLGWQFVSTSTDSETQLFSWMPSILATALNLTVSQVQTFALQVYIPGDYTGPQDVAKLLTTYMVYLPSSSVSELADQLKARGSAFYTALGSPYKDLAAHVNPSFAITSVGANSIPGSGSSTEASSSGASSKDNTRTDAIIGVVSALGGLTLIVLAFLVYRSIKKRRELAHTRLAEPPAQEPYADRAGREFDQDSVGGQRRRSFYFAEDSLRGYGSVMSGGGFQDQPHRQNPQMQQVWHDEPQQAGPSGGYQDNNVEYSYLDHAPAEQPVRQRGGGGAPAISAPIMQQSTMNW
ncbi:hypothetical protein PENSPDRAFT_476394 [Peniophora sp. CONT]|nr:hypothetical protein PENSPDRAFT_476394 [Peniophora sp. CONT]